MSTRPLVLLLAALLLLSACGGAGSDTADDDAGDDTTTASEAEPATSEPADTSEPPAAGTSESAGGAAIEVADSDLGEILVDGEGMTLYVFDNDTDGTSNCTGGCLDNWPPLPGDATAGDGVDEGLLGTTERDDGTAQATYDGQPLYHFAGDQAAGDVNGQAVGGIWWVVGPDGAKITEEVSQAGEGDSGGY